jgi:hypothetical protein
MRQDKNLRTVTQVWLTLRESPEGAKMISLNLWGDGVVEFCRTDDVQLSPAQTRELGRALLMLAERAEVILRDRAEAERKVIHAKPETEP